MDEVYFECLVMLSRVGAGACGMRQSAELPEPGELRVIARNKQLRRPLYCISSGGPSLRRGVAEPGPGHGNPHGEAEDGGK